MMTTATDSEAYSRTYEEHSGSSRHRTAERLVDASTPDPDAPDCESCGGGMAHYPECPEVERAWTADAMADQW